MRRIITQRSRTAWKSEKGLTFIEIMVAILIVGMVGTSVLVSYNLAHRFAVRNTNRTVAVQIAQATIEEEKRNGYNGVVSWGPTANNPYLGNTPNMTTQVTVSQPATDVRMVTVTVSWTDRDRTVNETLQTLLTQR